jgi:hypothetical protein
MTPEEPLTQPGPGQDDTTCQAAVTIRGETYRCDMQTVDLLGQPTLHQGWAHSNRAAKLVWRGDARIEPTIARGGDHD